MADRLLLIMLLSGDGDVVAVAAVPVAAAVVPGFFPSIAIPIVGLAERERVWSDVQSGDGIGEDVAEGREEKILDDGEHKRPGLQSPRGAPFCLRLSLCRNKAR